MARSRKLWSDWEQAALGTPSLPRFLQFCAAAPDVVSPAARRLGAHVAAFGGAIEADAAHVHQHDDDRHHDADERTTQADEETDLGAGGNLRRRDGQHRHAGRTESVAAGTERSRRGKGPLHAIVDGHHAPHAFERQHHRVLAIDAHREHGARLHLGNLQLRDHGLHARDVGRASGRVHVHRELQLQVTVTVDDHRHPTHLHAQHLRRSLHAIAKQTLALGVGLAQACEHANDHEDGQRRRDDDHHDDTEQG